MALPVYLYYRDSSMVGAAVCWNPGYPTAVCSTA